MGKKRDKKSKSDESAKSVTSGSRGDPVYRPPHQAPAVIVERPAYITTTIRYPRYVISLMEDWLLRHPGHSKTSMLLNGLRCMGVAIEDEDLVPKRGHGSMTSPRPDLDEEVAC